MAETSNIDFRGRRHHRDIARRDVQLSFLHLHTNDSSNGLPHASFRPPPGARRLPAHDVRLRTPQHRHGPVQAGLPELHTSRCFPRNAEEPDPASSPPEDYRHHKRMDVKCWEDWAYLTHEQDPVPVPNPDYTHGSYHWSFERWVTFILSIMKRWNIRNSSTLLHGEGTTVADFWLKS